MSLLSAVQISVFILALQSMFGRINKSQTLGFGYFGFFMCIWMTFNRLAIYGLLGAIVLNMPFSQSLSEKFNEWLTHVAIPKLRKSLGIVNQTSEGNQ